MESIRENKIKKIVSGINSLKDYSITVKEFENNRILNYIKKCMQLILNFTYVILRF